MSMSRCVIPEGPRGSLLPRTDKVFMCMGECRSFHPPLASAVAELRRLRREGPRHPIGWCLDSIMFRRSPVRLPILSTGLRCRHEKIP